MKLHLIGFVAIGALGLSACSSGKNTSPASPPGDAQLGALRVVNAISNSSTLDVDITRNDTPLQGFQDVAFGTSSAFGFGPPGSYTLKLQVTPASGGNPDTIPVDNTPVDVDQQTTVYATGTLVTGTPSSFLVEQTPTLTDGQVEITLVNVASQLASQYPDGISVYIVSPGSGLGGIQPVATAQQFPAYSAPTLMTVDPNKRYELIVTAANNSATQLFDSGPNGIALNGKTSLQFAVLDAPGQPDGAPVSLLELTSTGTSAALKNNKN